MIKRVHATPQQSEFRHVGHGQARARAGLKARGHRGFLGTEIR
jgi:hypothetical protein